MAGAAPLEPLDFHLSLQNHRNLITYHPTRLIKIIRRFLFATKRDIMKPGGDMSRAVKISEELVNEAEVYSKSFNRSISSQIEFWTKIGKISEENPDMSFNEIKDILIAREEVNAGLVSEYQFG